MSNAQLIVVFVANAFFFAAGYYRGRVVQMRDEMKFLKRMRASK